MKFHFLEWNSLYIFMILISHAVCVHVDVCVCMLVSVESC